MTKVMGGHNQRMSETYSEIAADTFAIGAEARRVWEEGKRKNWTTLIQADPDNDADVFVGSGLLQPIQLAAGESITIACDAYDIFVNGNGQTVNILVLM